jgi:hypothetical protein
MLYVGLDLSRKRLDWHALRPDGERVAFGAVSADADGLAGLARRLGDASEQVIAVIESMNGARFVHDRLELAGWDVRVADPMKCKGLAPLGTERRRFAQCQLWAELGSAQTTCSCPRGRSAFHGAQALLGQADGRGRRPSRCQGRFPVASPRFSRRRVWTVRKLPPFACGSGSGATLLLAWRSGLCS